MKLYLIRHGETVDNVAGLYAGVSDSALTNHGFEQALRLGDYFSRNYVTFSHIFSSPLSRAVKTAAAVRDAQPSVQASEGSDRLQIVKVPELIERDYGSYEGKPYATRSEWMKTGSDGHEETRNNEPGFVNVETTESLAKRGDTFWDQHIFPLLNNSGDEVVVAIVAHGMLLSHLWRRLLLRLPRKSLTIAPEVTAARGEIIPDRLGGWSNTGYLELSLRKDGEPAAKATADSGTSHAASDAAEKATMPTPIPPPLQSEGAEVSVASPHRGDPAVANKSGPRILYGWSTTILAIDSKEHLVGLKRQPGGIGSSAHDEGQKKLDTFFKRQKLS